jgi:hypothetical protein
VRTRGSSHLVQFPLGQGQESLEGRRTPFTPGDETFGHSVFGEILQPVPPCEPAQATAICEKLYQLAVPAEQESEPRAGVPPFLGRYLVRRDLHFATRLPDETAAKKE